MTDKADLREFFQDPRETLVARVVSVMLKVQEHRDCRLLCDLGDHFDGPRIGVQHELLLADSDGARLQDAPDLVTRVTEIRHFVGKKGELSRQLPADFDDPVVTAASRFQTEKTAGGKKNCMSDTHGALMGHQLPVRPAGVVGMLMNVDDRFGGRLREGGDEGRRCQGAKEATTRDLDHTAQTAIASLDFLRRLIVRLYLVLVHLMFGAALRAAAPDVPARELPRIPPTAPAEAVATCALRPGFRLELMAAEPLVVDPVALAFDETGRLFVIEMRDYSEHREEKLGRVKLLEDSDGDGVYDRATVFADGLSWPTGVTCWDGGVFVLASPDLLYFKDTDGDRRADVHALIFTGFGNEAEKLNVQALPNSLQWGPDQRIHGALGGNPGPVRNFTRPRAPAIELRGHDFSFDPRMMDLRAESGGGQFGMTFDDTGRKLVCANSRHLMQLMYEERVEARVLDYPLPAPAIDIAADGPQAEVFRRSPDEPWRVLRTQWRVSGVVKGLVEGGGRASGYFTSASGLTVYRGDAWPEEYRGNVFIADPGSNLIHRKRLEGDLGLTGRRAVDEERCEFLASSDNWFRPVVLANAPDGNLWFADMYREIIEHPWSLPEGLKQHLDLDSGNDRGRIYRIAANSSPGRPLSPAIPAKISDLVGWLDHSNGWHRDTAARLLHQFQDKAIAPAVAELAQTAMRPATRFLALHVLHGLGALDAAVLSQALRDNDAGVRAGAVRFCAQSAFCAEQVANRANDSSARVRAEVAWGLLTLAVPERAAVVATLLEQADEPWLRHAALAAIGSERPAVLAKLEERDPSRAQEMRELLAPKTVKTSMTQPLAAGPPRGDSTEFFRPALTLPGNAGNGRTTFEARCALCHRHGGKGSAVGPDLDAAGAGGREKLLGNILDPSREITAGYVSGTVETQEGESISGILLNETRGGIVMRVPGGREAIVRRSEIKSVERHSLSLMPAGLEAGLTPQDMADLLEFLSATRAVGAAP